MRTEVVAFVVSTVAQVRDDHRDPYSRRNDLMDVGSLGGGKGCFKCGGPHFEKDCSQLRKGDSKGQGS